MWRSLLEDSGFSVIPVDQAHVTLRRGAQHSRYTVIERSSRVYPSDVHAPPERRSLLVVPAVSEAAARRAHAYGWSVIPEKGPAWIFFQGREIELRRPPVGAPVKQTRGRGRPGWGIFSIVRTLLALGGSRQEELAEFAHIGQPRVSQVLRELVARGLVDRGPDGWLVSDKSRIIQWWIANYPGPGGLASHWYGLDPVVEQAYRVHELLAATRSRPAVSGDVAADLVAPWRRPGHALLYADRGAELGKAGLTAASVHEATLTLVLPADRAVWAISRTPWTVAIPGFGDVARAGALQVLYDLTRAAGPDAGDAAQAWLDWMLSEDPVV